MTYTYDNASRREAMVDPDGGRSTYLYDNASRLTSLLNPFTERTTWAYHAAGRATTVTLANGTRTTTGYDDASQVTAIRHSKSDDTQVAKYEYSYNDAGVRTSVLEGSGDRVTWSYDNAWRLTREQRSGDNAYDITYCYDPVGSRATKLTGGVTTTYSYNAGDAVTGADAGGTLTTYSWDDAGNNTVVNANGTLTTYTWDGENRLKTIQTASGTITLAYDAGGLRRTRQDASTTRKFVWEFQSLLLETDGDGTTVAQYTGALDTYGPVVSQRRSSTSRFYHPSVLGTIETLTGADAATTDTYILDAWGVQHAATGSTVNPFRYVGALGYYTEPDLALAYVRARWLRPATGSWLSVDPVEGEARYGYVGGSATAATDASGRHHGAFNFGDIPGPRPAPPPIPAPSGGSGTGGGGWVAGPPCTTPASPGVADEAAGGAAGVIGGGWGQEITKRQIVEACIAEGRSREWCLKFAKLFKGKTCGALWRWCIHLGMGKTPVSRHHAEMCLSVHHTLCGPAPDCTPVGGL